MNFRRMRARTRAPTHPGELFFFFKPSSPFSGPAQMWGICACDPFILLSRAVISYCSSCSCIPSFSSVLIFSFLVKWIRVCYTHGRSCTTSFKRSPSLKKKKKKNNVSILDRQLKPDARSVENNTKILVSMPSVLCLAGNRSYVMRRLNEGN